MLVQQMMLHKCRADFAVDEGNPFGDSDHSISNGQHNYMGWIDAFWRVNSDWKLSAENARQGNREREAKYTLA